MLRLLEYTPFVFCLLVGYAAGCLTRLVVDVSRKKSEPDQKIILPGLVTFFLLFIPQPLMAQKIIPESVTVYLGDTAAVRFAGFPVGRYRLSMVNSSTGRTATKSTVVRVVPRPPEPPIPPQPPGVLAECAAPKVEWVWCDDFEQDRLAKYFEYDAAGGGFMRVAGVGYSGSLGMRGRWIGGAQGAGSLHLALGRTPSTYFRPVDAGTQNYRDLYWRIYVKNQVGWIGGGADKLSRALVFSGSNWSEAALAHVWSGATATDNTILAIDPASGTDAAGTVLTQGYNDWARLRWLGMVRGSLPLYDAGHVGQWQCVEAHAKLNDPGQANGVFELWVNDQLQAQKSALNWIGNYSAYGWNAVFFENYWNAGAAATQERYFDNIVVSTARIRCS